MLTTFNSLFISNRANEFVNVISAVQVNGITKGQLLRILGKRLSDFPPMEDQRLSVFNAASKTISTITNATEYIQAIEPWTEYISLNAEVSLQCSISSERLLNKNMSFIQINDVNVVLGDIISRMNYNRNFETHYVELQSICYKIIDSTKNLEALLISVSV